MLARLFATASFAMLTLPAQAATLFQSLPDLTVDPVVAGYCSSCNAFLQFRIYDGFTLTAASTINRVTFAVDTSFYPGASIDVGFFERAGGLPGAAIANFTFAPSQFVSIAPVATASERTRALVTIDIGALDLAAGSYDVSFFNPTGLSIPAYANPGGSLYQSGNFFIPGQIYADLSAAFAIDGTSAGVPEPASWALLIAGFGLTGAAGRRRRHAAA